MSFLGLYALTCSLLEFSVFRIHIFPSSLVLLEGFVYYPHRRRSYSWFTIPIWKKEPHVRLFSRTEYSPPPHRTFAGPFLPMTDFVQKLLISGPSWRRKTSWRLPGRIMQVRVSPPPQKKLLDSWNIGKKFKRTNWPWACGLTA